MQRLRGQMARQPPLQFNMPKLMDRANLAQHNPLVGVSWWAAVPSSSAASQRPSHQFFIGGDAEG
jgi:hypothetical protein